MSTSTATSTDIRQSCVSEAQKYEGALYRPKQSKADKRKSVSIAEPSNALVPRKAYVEDDPDDAPPAAPSPPPAVRTVTTPSAPAPAVNVFDFLVSDETPNASKVSLGGSREQMQMKINAPSVFEAGPHSARRGSEDYHDERFEEHGFSYGNAPIKPSQLPPSESMASFDFTTPAPKKGKSKNKDRPTSASHSRNDSQTTSDKKRKRGQPEELDLTVANGTTPRYELEGDTAMVEAPNGGTPALNHSGLTGGLKNLLKSEFPPSPDYSGGDDERSRPQDPASPLKRSRHSNDDSGLGISIKGRAGRIMSMIGGVAGVSTISGHDRSLARARRRSSSEDGSQGKETSQSRRPRKHHRVHRHNGTSHVQHPSHARSRRRSSHVDEERPARRLKAIEYNGQAAGSISDSDAANGDSQMVVYQTTQLQQMRAEHFLSFVTKGPDSEKGCSINKALKRYHREASGSKGKAEEEKELWKSLRLRRNEKGEVVVFFQG